MTQDTDGTTHRLTRSARRAAAKLNQADGRAARASSAVSDHPLVRAISWFSELGDQPQLRILCGATMTAGLFAGNRRLIGAGARMLATHELTTLCKDLIKGRVDRRRPRQAESERQRRPRLGKHSGKEITSFPSGHSAGAIAVAQAFSREFPEYRLPAFAVAGSVAAAQIPRCAHYPTDVGAGLLLGLAVEASTGPLWNRLFRS